MTHVQMVFSLALAHKDIIAIVAGAVLLALAWPPICGRIIYSVAPWTVVSTPRGVNKDEWANVLTTPRTRGNVLIGALESLFIYMTVLVAQNDAALAIGGWLAFKVASKWEIFGLDASVLHVHTR